MKAVRSNRLRGICAVKLKSNEMANDFVDWIYNYKVPEKFTLSEVINDFQTDSDLDQQAFAGCLKAYFDLEIISFSKNRERVDGKQIAVWKT